MAIPFKVEGAIGQDVEIPDLRCLSCDAQCDAATAVGFTGIVYPEEGDLTVCASCGHLMAFTDKGYALRNLTAKELSFALQNKHVQAVQRARAQRNN